MSRIRKFECAGCGKTLPVEEFAVSCPTCGQPFCKSCYEKNILDAHALDHDFD